MELRALRDAILQTLNTITDPCSVAGGAPGGLVDMGLVRRLEVTDGPDGVDVLVVIGVTEFGCLMAAPFAVEARKRISSLPGVRSVAVELDDKFDWDPRDMSPSYRAHLRERHRLGRERMLPGFPSTLARD